MEQEQSIQPKELSHQPCQRRTCKEVLYMCLVPQVEAAVLGGSRDGLIRMIKEKAKDHLGAEH